MRGCPRESRLRTGAGAEQNEGRDEEGGKSQVEVDGIGGGSGGGVQRRGAPAEAAASDREGRVTPKREGAEDEEIARRD